MANGNKRPTLVDIVKVEQKNTIQFPNAVIEIFTNKKQEKCDISIKTKIGNFERIENKNNYDLKSKIVFISSYNIEGKCYWLYSLIIN